MYIYKILINSYLYKEWGRCKDHNETYECFMRGKSFGWTYL